MDKKEFIECLSSIIYAEAIQTKKGKTIKTHLATQRRCINKIAKALDVEQLSLDEVSEISFG